jgi:hypothetical protein
MPTNWWETFFNGAAVDMWLQAIPEELSKKEADRLEGLLNRSPGAEILMCRVVQVACARSADGPSRPALICRRSRSARMRAAGRSVMGAPDMRDLPWPGRFDAAAASATASDT